MATLRAGHHGLDHVGGAVDAAGERQVGLDVAVQHRDPVQPQQQLVRIAEDQVGHHFQRFQIEIRLVEAVEQHQAVGAGGIQLACAMLASELKYGPSFTADRDAHVPACTACTRST